MVSEELRVRVRRHSYAEHWNIGAIASELGVHADTVRGAIEAAPFQTRDFVRPSIVDPYTAFIRDRLGQHPRLRAIRILQMVRDRAAIPAASCNCAARWRGCVRKSANPS